MSPQNRKPSKRPPALGQSQTKPWVRFTIILIVVLLVLGTLGAVLVSNNDSSDSSNVSTEGSSSTLPADTPPSTPALASAEGKPCVVLADPLPAGAPAVPITVGAPPTELMSKDIQVGTGATVVPTSTLTVDYIGVSCSTGKIFDTSYGKQPAEFPLANVVPGWQKGLPGMKVGGVRLLAIPPADAYGTDGYPPAIAPDETLWFVVSLKGVK